MRTHGTLTKWNDDRGFGFITPAKGPSELFVHISAFPRDGTRPQINELISFEEETAPDGRRRAVRVMRPGQRSQKAAARHRLASGDQSGPGRHSRFGALALLALAGVGIYGYSRYTRHTPSPAASHETAPLESMSSPREAALPQSTPLPRYTCDGRKYCSQMTSCDEAKFFLRSCPDTQMDGDGDGLPCESQWCNGSP